MFLIVLNLYKLKKGKRNKNKIWNYYDNKKNEREMEMQLNFSPRILIN